MSSFSKFKSLMIREIYKAYYERIRSTTGNRTIMYAVKF